jgi:alpha-galactosidase
VTRLVQLLPPGLVWQPALDEPDDATSTAYRAVSAFFGRLGLGIDLRKQAPGSLRAIHRWLALHKRFRPLLHSGTTVRSDESDRGFVAHGVVADDRREALFALVWLERALASRRVRIDGLDPVTSYRIEVIGARPGEAQAVTPAWASADPVLTGQALGAAGIPLPPARRGAALLLHLESVAQPFRRRNTRARAFLSRRTRCNVCIVKATRAEQRSRSCSSHTCGPSLLWA